MMFQPDAIKMTFMGRKLEQVFLAVTLICSWTSAGNCHVVVPGVPHPHPGFSAYATISMSRRHRANRGSYVTREVCI